MYRCNVCSNVNQPKQPMRRAIIKRADGSILREIPVCNPCGDALNRGTSLSVLMRQHQPAETAAPLTARLGLPVEVGYEHAQDEDWRDFGIQGTLTSTAVGRYGTILIRPGQVERFRRMSTDHWMFNVAGTSQWTISPMSLSQAVAYVKQLMK